MRSEKYLVEKYDAHKITLPNRWIYDTVMAYGHIEAQYAHIKAYYHFDKKSMKGKQVIVIADHANLNIPLYVMAYYPFVRLNVVGAYPDLFIKFAYYPLTQMGYIAKRQFTTDLRAVRQMAQVISMGGSLVFFPEGVPSISGSNYPINPSTVDLLKTFGVTVVLCKSYGLQCSSPFYKKPVVGKGHQEIHYEILFTPEELKEKSCDELYVKLRDRMYYRDFEWAAENGYSYHRRGESNAHDLDNICYLCPKCGAEHVLEIEGDIIRCTNCGNSITMDDSFALYPTDSDSVCPYRNPDDWCKAQREKIREDIKNPNFSISYESELFTQHFDRLHLDQFYSIGEGTVTINHSSVHYCGTRDGQDVNLDFDIKMIPSFLYLRKNNYFYFLEHQLFNVLYYHNEQFFFRPKTDRKRMLQYQMIVEELHNLVDPVWDKVCRDAFDTP